MADKEYAPWSRESSDGLITSAVDSHVRVSQDVVPALNVGTIDRLTGKWEGAQVSDRLFLVDPTHEAVKDSVALLNKSLRALPVAEGLDPLKFSPELTGFRLAKL